MNREAGDYSLEEHQHRFAVWAAARASQRGLTSIEVLQRALEATGIRERLAIASTYAISQAEFDAQHREWCNSIRSSLLGLNVSYGRAAKLVAVYLKARVVMGSQSGSPLASHMHPPIDRILIHNLVRRELIGSKWGSAAWTSLPEDDYFDLLGEIRRAVGRQPVWTIEVHWEPSQGSGDVSKRAT